jgi:hypothetical protein
LENTKLISLLKSFTPEEQKEFQKFVDSPFYNNEKSVSRFYKLLRKSAPEFNPGNIKREKLYRKLYPEKSYNDVVMRNIISRTLKLAEDYVTITKFQQEKDYRALVKMRSLSNRDQAFLFEKARREAEKIIKENPYRDEGYYYSRMIYEDEVRRFTQRMSNSIFVVKDNIQKIADNGVYFAATSLLTLYAIMTNQKKHIMEINFDFGLMNKILEYYESNPGFFENVPYAALYYNSIKLFITEDEKYFQKVHEIALKNYDSLKDVHRKNAYVVLVNYCTARINKGDMHYLRIKFDLYKEIIENRAHYEGLNFISHVFYNRVAFTAINIGETEWAMQFIEKYRKELNGEHKENSYYLAMTEFHTKIENYDTALEYLSKVRHSDHLYKREVYGLSLKIFYSADMIESFHAEIENFRNFLKSNKMVSPEKKKLGLNFISLIKGLFNLKYKKNFGDKYDIFELRKKILENKFVIDKFWLLEKLSDLESDNNRV